jgi:hypothetical protein
MFGPLRCLARSAIVNVRSNTRTSSIALAPTLSKSSVHSTISSAFCKRYLHVSSSRAAGAIDDGVTTELSSPEASESMSLTPSTDFDRHQRRYGFSSADVPLLIYLRISQKATEEDMKALLIRAGFP